MPSTDNHKVVMISMPWAATTQPSPAVGVLTAICREERFPVTALYLNMDMNTAIGFEAAGKLATDRALYGLSEHLFACDLFGSEALSSDDFVEALTELDVSPPFNDATYIKRLRDEVIPQFLDDVEERVLQEEPSVVGFSATFNQVMSSLALARRLRKKLSNVRVIVGGACFDGEMGIEYHRAMPGILDHVFMGEADDSFREYLRLVRGGEAVEGIPGVTWFDAGVVKFVPGQPKADLNQSPMPDYDDFFREKERMQQKTGRVFNIDSLPFESSRGCWWGEKSQCMFCGLNVESIPFREKTVDRVISEIVTLSARYRIANFTASDWIISRKSRAEIFRRLSELDLDIECFYETRADLSKEEIALMRRAGIRRVQPGIEALSTQLLRLMRKGTTRIRHIQFLRWCREYDIRLHYNLLCGFPGEEAEWYREMAEFLPRIMYLPPPLHNLHPIEMHRFSPLFEMRDRFDVSEWRVREDYGFNFPPGFLDLEKVGYFFTFQGSTVVPQTEYSDCARQVIGKWLEAHESGRSPVYHYIIGPGFLRINDTREGEGRCLFLADMHQDILLLCDKIQSIQTLKELLEPCYPSETAVGSVERVVEELVREDLMMEENGLFLTLPIGYRPRTTQEIYSYVVGDESNSSAALNVCEKALQRPPLAGISA